MSKPIATEVRVSAHGQVVIGRRTLGTSVYFRPTGVARFEELVLRFEPPRRTPATLLADGRLLVVGRNGETLLVSVGRTPQPGPSTVSVEGLSVEGVVFAKGPRFFRFVNGGWRNESPEGSAPTLADQRSVFAMGDFAVGEGPSLWVFGDQRWSAIANPAAAPLSCAAGAWAGGVGEVLERRGKRFVTHAVRGTVSAICPWHDSALLVIDGRLVDLQGRAFKAPGSVSSIAAHDNVLWCLANGSLFESTDLKRFRRQVLPS
jgi:hypothetical protein